MLTLGQVCDCSFKSKMACGLRSTVKRNLLTETNRFRFKSDKVAEVSYASKYSYITL
jgi:hypothetical protein